MTYFSFCGLNVRELINADVAVVLVCGDLVMQKTRSLQTHNKRVLEIRNSWDLAIISVFNLDEFKDYDCPFETIRHHLCTTQTELIRFCSFLHSLPVHVSI